MAKTYKNIFDRVCNFDALHAAYLRARRGKRQRREVARFEQDLEGNLIQLQNDLIWGSYRTGRYRYFEVTEPKRRLVAALPFRDRVVQHALVAAIEPIWEERFIHDSYACRPNKGSHRGADRAQEFLRSVKRKHGFAYAYKADIAKYFANIDHEILKRLLRKRVACKRTLALLDGIIDSQGVACGIPIGNLTSQLFANIYLHELDEFVKYELREPHYLRYMDDFVVLHHDKKHLALIRFEVEVFLDSELRLMTNNKSQIFPVSLLCGRPLDFLGYRIWPTHRKLRKNSVNRMRRRLRSMVRQYAAGRLRFDRIRCRIASWLGHAKHADSRSIRENLLANTIFERRA
ncbi:MAG: reverse transcriptase/maturase family protein [Geobacteraceae bacterium]|nr:reverse transcriptase/maturase family protein [Geobacteraceae bacterium]